MGVEGCGEICSFNRINCKYCNTMETNRAEISINAPNTQPLGLPSHNTSGTKYFGLHQLLHIDRVPLTLYEFIQLKKCSLCIMLT